MTRQSIRLFGDPVLASPSLEVVNFDKELQILVKDLTDTMLEAEGAGLAAPQIGVSLRVFTWNIDDQIGHLINPKLHLSTEIQEGDEGCLSFPGLVYDCHRALNVVALGFNMYGEPVEIVGSELMARCLQHETDHLDGILFIDRLSKELRKEALKEVRDSEWFNLNAPEIRVSPHQTLGFSGPYGFSS